jgi:cytochrome c5
MVRRALRNWKIICVLTTAVVVETGSMGGQSSSQPASTGASKPAAEDNPGQVHRIVLPQYPPEIVDGPNVQVYRKDCLLCHTARYVSMQPRFSKTVWQNEVKKMVDVYGAAISEADQALIVEYLVAVRGADTAATRAVPPK